MSKKNSIQINAILNVIKQCCVIIFPLVTFSYTSRVLGADNLGRFSFSDSVISYLYVLASLGIPTYAVREVSRIRNQKKQLEKMTNELFSINIVMTIITMLLLIILVDFIPRLSQDRILIIILSTTIICNTFGRDWINTVFEDFSFLTLIYIITQVISLVLILTMVKSRSDLIVYTIIMAFSRSFYYLLNLFHTKKYVPYRLTLHFNLTQHFKPILYLFCISIATTIYVKSDIIILGFFRSNSEVGIYSLATNVYLVIKSLLNAIITVAIPRLSLFLGENNKKMYMKLLNGLRISLYTLMIPSVIGAWFLSKDILMVLGGRAFIYGFVSLRILCIALLFTVFGCFYSQAVLVPNRDERSYFFATMISALINIGLNFIFIPLFGINGAALTTVIAELTVVIICKKRSSNYLFNFSKINFLPICIGCGLIGIICILMQLYVQSFAIRIMGSVGLSVFVYAIILLLGKNPLALEAVQFINSKISLKK